MTPKRTQRLHEILATCIIATIMWVFTLIRLITVANLNDANYTVAINNFFSQKMPSFLYIEMYSEDLPVLIFGMLIFFAIMFVIAMKSIFLLQDRPGEEEGSAKWNTSIKKYNKHFTEPFGSTSCEGFGNTILAQLVGLALSWATGRNNNFLIIGGSGSGKTRYFVKPNVLQANASFIITDPSAAILNSCGKFLEETMGYKLKVFNTIDMSFSNAYNPFNYIHKQSDILVMIDSLIKNTTPSAEAKGDFWEKSERLLLTAVCYYLWKNGDPERRNFAEVARLVRLAKVDENNSSKAIELDKIFDPLPETDFGKKQYTSFRTASGKTLASIVISVLVRLAVFDFEDVKALTCQDNLNLTELGEEKQVLFVIMPPTDDSPYKFLVSMIYTQLFDGLFYKATYLSKYVVRGAKSHEPIKAYASEEEAQEVISRLQNYRIMQTDNNTYAIKYLTASRINAEDALESEFTIFKDGSKPYIERQEQIINEGLEIHRQKAVELPVYVRFILDEFANLGSIPDFTNRLATIRQYNISCCVILQNYSQLTKNYKGQENSIAAQCDTILFLGSTDNFDKQATCEKISQILGKQTIRTKSESTSRSAKGGSGSASMQRKGRPLMTPDEVSNIDPSECIIKIRAVDPFRVKKHDYVSHPRYKYTADADPENFFDYMVRQWRPVHKDEEGENVPLDESKAEGLISKPHMLTPEEFYELTGESSVADITIQDVINPLVPGEEQEQESGIIVPEDDSRNAPDDFAADIQGFY